MVEYSKNILLGGEIIISGNKYDCVLHILGLGGAFDCLVQSIANGCCAISFVCVWPQISYIDKDAKKIKHEKYIGLHSGVCYKNFANTILDIDAYVNYSNKAGFLIIFFVRHSYGCNKIVGYLSEIDTPKFRGCVFLVSTEFDLASVRRYTGLIK